MATALFPTIGEQVLFAGSKAPVTIEAKIAEGAEGIVYRARLGLGDDIAVKWYRPSNDAPRKREAVIRLAAYGRPHAAFAWPLDLVESPNIQGFGYVMPLVPSSFRSLVAVLQDAVQPSFRRLLSIGRNLVDAFAALHSHGLSYRDISFGNLLVDPLTSEVAIVDNDNVGVESIDAFVLGTLRFMAPEVLRGDAKPSTTTDLYSLAVFLFYLLVHGHPLAGLRVDAEYNCGESSETDVIIRHFGHRPLFVFDPHDSSNRPPENDPMSTWWGIYPDAFRQLFIKAFTVGIHDTTLTGRVTEGVWRRALVQLENSLHVCSCTASVFWDADHPDKPCWHCGHIPPTPVVLALPRHSVVLSEGAVLTSHHFSNDRNFETIRAVVERHPQEPGRLVVRNLSDRKWTIRPRGEEPKELPAGSRMAVRPMEIDFGDIQGSISDATTNAALIDRIEPGTSPNDIS